MSTTSEPRRFAVAVVGSTGLVGETLIQVLEERDFPVSELHPLASDRSVGKAVAFRGRRLPVRELAGFDFTGVDLAMFCAGPEASRAHVPRATACGCVVIDNTMLFRDEADVPLVVPEVNPEAIAQYGKRGLIANPSSSAIQLLVALNPIHRAVGVVSVNLCTYESVSGAGREAVAELAEQTAQLLGGRSPVKAHVLPKQIAFNCLPQVEDFEDNGYTQQEMSVLRETHRILADPGIRLNATAVRVPVFYGSSQVVHLQTRRPLTVEEARQALAAAPGVEVVDDRRPGGYPTAATEAANRDTVYVGRIREDQFPAGGLNLWVVADNVRKGAATNMVQIAEILARQHM